jgi:hypothetical protein
MKQAKDQRMAKPANEIAFTESFQGEELFQT